MPGHVFISYSRRDSAYVKELAAHLTSANIPIWIDETLEPGTPTWVRAIERAVEQSAAVVPVMTTASAESAWVDREIDLAQELGKPILPLLVDGRRFLRLRDMQIEDASGGRMPGPTFVARLQALTGVSGASVAAAPARDRSDGVTVTPVRSLVGHTAAVVGVAWSPDGQLLATASDDRTARIWDAATATPVAVLSGHGNHVSAVCWSPEGSLLVTASSDASVRLWDAASGTVTHELRAPDRPMVNHAALAPDGRVLATGDEFHLVRLWEVTAGSVSATLAGHDGPVSSVAWSPDGTLLASGSWDRTVRIWSAAGKKARAVLAGHEEIVRAVAWSPDGRTVASACFDGTVRVWDPRTVTCIHVLAGHGRDARWVGWSPSGGLLASVGADHTLRLWDPRAGSVVLTVTVSSTGQSALRRFWSGDRDSVLSAAWAPDGRHIATGSQDGTVRIWAVRTAG